MSRVLVITGGIGSGKSEVCRILRRLGFTFQYDADSRVKMLYKDCDGLLDRIEVSLGCRLRDEAGEFRPVLLADRIFSDRQALDTVESIVFPALADDFRKYVHESERTPGFPGIVILESATILEKRFFDGLYDSAVFVEAPFEVRLGRACRRDGVDKEKILARMANQTFANAVSDGSINSYPADSQEAAMYRRIDSFLNTDCSLEELANRVSDMIKTVITKKL